MRRYSGWILYFYAFTHLLNHSMGIFGLDILERSREIFIGFWRNPVLEWLVVACLVIHLLLVLYRLFTAKTFKGLSGVEWTQVVLGLCIPDMMIHHVSETKIARELFNTEDSYSYYLYWTPDYYTILFVLTIIVVWAHGSIGIKLYLKQKSWYPKWRAWLAGIAVGLPVASFFGVYAAEREVERLATDPEWVAQLEKISNPDNADLLQWHQSWEYPVTLAYVGFVILFFAVRKLVMYLKKQALGVTVKYVEGTEITITKGTTLLEASLLAGIPHAHVCGGRGRCSTCRVHVIDGFDKLPPPSDRERALLNKVSCNKNVRLACQTKPVEGCTVHPLLIPNVSLQQTLWKKTNYTGVDMDVAVLFADLRGFTALAENKLPYDVVFILNQYFQFMGHAIETHNGRVDKFIGDAIMAVFGIKGDLPQACHDALAAARSMRFQLDRLNAQLEHELPTPLKLGCGIHSGRVIIGEMGYREMNNLVAIGDATNTASRLESLTKEYDCDLVVSKEVLDAAGFEMNGSKPIQVELRGKQRPLDVFIIEDAKLMEV